MKAQSRNVYAIAPNGVFWSIQGEGHLRGFQMAFLRLAGCSVGCAECDTNYSVEAKHTADDLAQMVDSITPANNRDRWCWVTGGEPYDRDLGPLFKALRSKGFSIAVATSGVHRCISPVDWLSVSPHGGVLMQQYGNEVKLVVGLNGLDPWQWLEQYPDSQTEFMYRYVQPVWVEGKECPQSLQRCLDFLKENSNWALSRQDHKHWGQA